MSGTKNIFFIYTKEDSTLLLQVLDQLYPLKKEAGVSFWYDDPIYPDKNWYPQIVSRFEEADVYIFLISNTFMYSSFIQQLEFKQVVDRYRNNDALLIPILIDDCPWDIDFSSDEYTFSFKQLQVLPEAGKPLRSWSSPKKALDVSADYIRRKIASTIAYSERLASKVDAAAIPEDMPLKDTTVDKANDTVAPKAETATKSKTQDSAEGEEVEEKTEEVLPEVMEEVVPTAIEDVEEVARTTYQHEEERSPNDSVTEDLPPYQNDETPPKNTINRKRILLGIAATVLIILGSIVLSQFGKNSEGELLPETKNGTSATDASSPKEAVPASTSEVSVAEQPEASSSNAAAAELTLTIGDSYGDGLIFEIDTNGKTGRVAHRNDLGPMIWTDALKIHEELGEGWRLPTHDELKSMYDVLGQGADNDGQFADDLYWSATPYDENQAKLVRFTDGNASYHYNSRGTHRQFLVRAVRDFNSSTSSTEN
ncbi:Lcl domain-containing protein [Maribacter sp.]